MQWNALVRKLLALARGGFTLLTLKMCYINLIYKMPCWNTIKIYCILKTADKIKRCLFKEGVLHNRF
ncbi:hypothetical protein [Helicobacter pylori]|uniref:hypothetical protein n=1 Tax=Helicobacter pylori TaxID=210 RepID=UPI003F5B5208